MVKFNHLDPGTPELEWITSDRWTDYEESPLTNIDHLVVVAAHPDDETLGAAGLILHAHEQGIRTRVIIATDGEASHPRSSTHSPEGLGAIRRAEAQTALRILTPDAEVDFVGIADGHISDNRDQLSRHIADAVDESNALRTRVIAPWREDGHRDHNAAGRVAAEVARDMGTKLLEYPIWMWHWATPDNASVPWADMRRLSLTVAEVAAKGAAMRKHISQTHPLSDRLGDEALLNLHMQDHFQRDFETFIQTPIARSQRSSSSLTEQFFNEFYEGKSDPWGFESRWYEQRKRAITIAALPRPRFLSALELGCSTGKLTRELAERCDRLLAIDIAEAPLRIARERLKDFPNVGMLKIAAPQGWPDGTFDLIVLSEVGYYWNDSDLRQVLEHTISSLSSDGIVIACHWRYPVVEYPMSGDQVHETLLRNPHLVRLSQHEEKDFLLDVFSRPPGFSVAEKAGMI